MCDDGQLLVDGAYTNNLPVDVMKSLGAATIIAVDVSNIEPTTPMAYGDALSGWWVLLVRMNPFLRRDQRIPHIGNIQSRLSFVSHVKVGCPPWFPFPFCTPGGTVPFFPMMLMNLFHTMNHPTPHGPQQLEAARRVPGCLFLKPPVSAYAPFEMRAFKEIYQVGYRYGQEVVEGWRRREGMLQECFGMGEGEGDAGPWEGAEAHVDSLAENPMTGDQDLTGMLTGLRRISRHTRRSSL